LHAHARGKFFSSSSEMRTSKYKKKKKKNGIKKILFKIFNKKKKIYFIHFSNSFLFSKKKFGPI